MSRDPDPTPPSARARLAFGPYVLDGVAGRLLHEGRELPLRPKAFELLRVLASRAGELVSKDELLDAVWGTRFVTEGVIKTTVGELREALGDDPRNPRWIETVPRRGYRFAGVAAAPAGASIPTPSPAPTPPPKATPAAAPAAAAAPEGLVGRAEPLARLGRAWQAVLGGERRVVFVSGDPGVGKSALAAAFVESLDDALVAHGQCVESFGAGEPYLPWLEALASLAASVDDLPALLRRVAPSWLAQLPWLHDGAEPGAPASAERMPREMAALLDALAQRQPLIVVLEDLHWSDHASAQLVDALARRKASARWLLLATFRATDLLLGDHPLAAIRRELRLHRLADEIGLDGLPSEALRQLLDAWCPGVSWSAADLASLHGHTEGVPLFARAVLDTLIAEGVLVERVPGQWQLAGRLPPRLPLPDRLAGLYERQFTALAPAQRELLEAAAVVGMEFDAAVLAAALQADAAEVHARCDGLVRGGRWLRAAGIEAPAGAPPSGRYRFGHALMHGLCLGRCSPARRVDLHRRVAAALVARHGGCGDELVAQLAYHHEQALDADAALPLLWRAIGQARRRQAPREVLALAERALALLPRAGVAQDDEARRRWVYDLAHSQASAIGTIDGYASSALREAAETALAAAEGRALDENLLNLHRILWLHHVLTARFDHALALADAAVQRALGVADASCRVQALSMLHFSAFKSGAFERARGAIALADALAPHIVPPDAAYARFFAQQAHERALIAAMLDTLQGRPEAADAQRLRQFPPQGYVPMARVLNGVLCELWRAWRGDAQAVADDAAEVLALIEREELTHGAAPHRVLLHWAQGVLGDAAQALPRLRAALAELMQSPHAADRAAMLDLAADLALRAGRADEAAADIDAAFAHVQASGERYMLARLWERRAQIAEARRDRAAADRARAAAAQAQRDLTAGSAA